MQLFFKDESSPEAREGKKAKFSASAGTPSERAHLSSLDADCDHAYLTNQFLGIDIHRLNPTPKTEFG